MKNLALGLLVAGLLFTLVPASAQDAGQSEFTLVSAKEGSNFYFRLDGQTQNNPTLVVPASSEITITFRNGDGVPHNLRVGNNEVSDIVAVEGDELTYTFTSGASGTVPYVCDIHPTTMKGTVRVAGGEEVPTPTPTPENGGSNTPGLGLVGGVLALAGVALLVARRR